MDDRVEGNAVPDVPRIPASAGALVFNPARA
jgi:hypothetical protein